MAASLLRFVDFRSRFHELVQTSGVTWEAVGFLAADDTVYPFGTDTKVISTVFEAMVAPFVHEIAAERGYSVEGAPQTVYPDFTLSQAGNAGRIAVDVKTTYRGFTGQMRLRVFRYTLGSYTSFLRTPLGDKNILYPYAEYSDHWVIGFLYTRTKGVPAKAVRREEAGRLRCPYRNVEFFVQEKYKIAGESPGSGNTANIGSFPTRDIGDLRDGKGPFADHGKEFCDEYWRHYGQYASTRRYRNVKEFIAWKKRRSATR